MGRIHHISTALTIASGGTSSGSVGRAALRAARAIAIFAPATLPETVNIAVSNDGGSTYCTLQSGGSDIAIAAGKALVIDAVAFDDLRLTATGAVGANRAFTTHVVEEV